MDVHMNYASAQEHVPEAKRNNRVLKECIRTTFHRLPYKAIPKIMIQFLVAESAPKLNLFPAKHGISSYYSPMAIVKNNRLDYSKHCLIPFGTYVQAHNEPDPTNMEAPPPYYA